MDKMFQAALFDLDGVVLDTESQYTTFGAGVFERYYGDGETYAQKIKGQTLTQIYHAYFDGDQQRQQLITSQLVDFEHNMGFPYIPGFEAFVTSLRASSVRTAIVTSSASDKMANVYRAHPELIPYFDLILTAGDFPRSKPAPDCYLLAASRLGVAPADCVVFEDSINGLRSGRDSGASVVGLATTNPREVVAPLADVVIPDFTVVTSPQCLADQLAAAHRQQ